MFKKIREFIEWLSAPDDEITLNVVLDKGAYKPTRAHANDAGLDLYCPEGEAQIIPARERGFIDTGVHIELPPNTMGEVRSRSGLFRRNGITTTGTIDVDYTGSVGVVLQNNSGLDFEVKAGDRIAQLVVTRIYTPKVKVVNKFTETERGNGGFGSTGK